MYNLTPFFLFYLQGCVYEHDVNCSPLTMGNTQCIYSLVEAPLVIPRQYNEDIHVPEKKLVPLWRNEQACLSDSTVKSFVVLVFWHVSLVATTY